MEDTTNMTMGKRILYYRKRMGMTQDQLAEKIGVSAQAVSKWEHDLSCPDVTTIPHLAEIFGISTDELLGVRGNEEESTVKEGIVIDKTDGDRFRCTWNFRGLYHLPWALFLVALGCIYLATTFMELDVGFWSLAWPLALAATGLSYCIRRISVFGCACTLGGIYFLLVNLRVLPDLITWPIVMGILLVLWGIHEATAPIRKAKRKEKYNYTQGDSRTYAKACKEKATREFSQNGGSVCADYAFCSDRITVSEPLFTGGKIEVSFGSLVADLRNCTHLSENCRLDLDVSFSSLVLILPANFSVQRQLDNCGMSTSVDGVPAPGAEVLLLTGDFNFGSLRIQYV